MLTATRHNKAASRRPLWVRSVSGLIKSAAGRYAPAGRRSKVSLHRDALTAPLRRALARRGLKRMPGLDTYTPRIGMHTVFIAKENILFLEEWIQHHRALGVSEFHLYDNSKVEITGQRGLHTERVGEIDKRGVPYDYLVTMTDDDIQAELDRLQREIPRVFVYEWSPEGRDGRVGHRQPRCQTQAVQRHQDTVDWMLFMDMDEYLVLGEGVELSRICRDLMVRGFVGAEFLEHTMENRYRHLDKMVPEIDRECLNEHDVPGNKILCYLPRTSRVNIHVFWPFSRAILGRERIHYRHYKCHHSVDGAKVAPLKPPATEHGPGWKLRRVRPDWREVVERTKGPGGHAEARLILGGDV